MKTKLKRFVSWVAAALVLAFVLLCFPYDPAKWTASEITERVDLLNEKAAVTTPHLMFGKKMRAANLALFEKVEQGQELSAQESAAYRVLYQSILKGPAVHAIAAGSPAHRAHQFQARGREQRWIAWDRRRA